MTDQLTPETRYDVVAYTDHGERHPPPPQGGLKFPEVYRASGDLRGAVAFEPGRRRYIVFDLLRVDMVGPPDWMIPRRWWTFVDKARAVAHALWFVR